MKSQSSRFVSFDSNLNSPTIISKLCLDKNEKGHSSGGREEILKRIGNKILSPKSVKYVTHSPKTYSKFSDLHKKILTGKKAKFMSSDKQFIKFETCKNESSKVLSDETSKKSADTFLKKSNIESYDAESRIDCSVFADSNYTSNLENNEDTLPVEVNDKNGQTKDINSDKNIKSSLKSQESNILSNSNNSNSNKSNFYETKVKKSGFKKSLTCIEKSNDVDP